MFSKSQSQTQSQTQFKTFCKVCFDAGKPEYVYTSHFVKASKDNNSAIVCPTLLAQECRYCKKNGHTVKYCKVLEKDNKQREKQTKTVQIRQETKTMVEKKPTTKNIYSALVEDSDDEDNVEKNVKPQAQAQAEAHAAIPGKISYASMAAKVLQKEQAQEQEKRQLQEKKQAAEAQAQLQEKKTSGYTGAIPQPRQRPIVFKRHWADSDSEESGDDEDEDEPMREVALF